MHELALWAFLLGGLVTTARATVFVKDDNTNALNTAASYVGGSGVPGPADSIQIDGTLTTTRTAVLGGSLTVHAIHVASNYAQRFTLGSTAGATLTLGAGGLNKTNASVAMNLSCSVVLGTNQTWNIAGNNLVFNGPSPIITDNGYTLLVTGGGTFDLRPTENFTCGSNVTITCNQVNINAGAADVTFAGANSFKSLLINQGIAEGSSFPADTAVATTSHFGNASSGTITLGGGGTSGKLVYNGPTASTPKTFTYDCRNSGTNTIKVSTTGQTLTLTARLLYANGSSQSNDKSWFLGGAGHLALNGAIGNAPGSTNGIGIVKNDTGTLTLRGTNTYSGGTVVNAGTLALDGNGSISNTTSILIAGGATFDVSGLGSPFVLGTNQALGNGSAATASVLKGSIHASNGLIAAITDGTAPAFLITNGTLTVSTSTVFQINSGISAIGSYPLIACASGGSVTGELPPISLYRATGHLQIAGGGLDLVVETSDLLNYFVSTTGSDITGDGTIGNPWQTITKARDVLRNLVSQTGDINVYLRGGRYELTNTISFTAADSGANGYYITYRSYPGEVATVSGGKRVTGWTHVTNQPYWVASVSTNAGFADYFRQLYVNGIRAERARSDWINGLQYVWTNGSSFYFSTANTGLSNVYGIAFATNSGLKNYSNVTDLRLLHVKHFKVDEFPIVSIITNSGKLCVQLQPPYCQSRYDYGAGYFDATSPWMMVSAFEELDEPGEWYLNRATRQVYYYPNSFEDMSTAVVYAPVVEPLMAIGGNSTASKVRNLRFQDLTFEHGNWFRPRDAYIGGGEAEGLYGISGSGGVYANTEVPGAIRLTNSIGIQFIGNTIQHQGTCGIHADSGTRDTLVQGNLFSDLTGAAVLNYHQYGPGEIPTNTIVADNVVRNIGMDFMGGTCLDNLGGYGFQALRNDLADCQYDGIHQHNGISSITNNPGHGAFVIASNRIALTMAGARYDVQDGGSIYTSGVWPPRSYIVGNDIYDMNQPNSGMWTFGLYQDYDSYGLLWSNNVMRDFYPGIKGGNWQGFDHAEWPNNTATHTYTDATVRNTAGLTAFSNYVQITNGIWPAAAQAIIQAAGVGPAYTGLVSRIYSGSNLARGKVTWSSSSNGSSQAGADWNYQTAWHSAANDSNSWWAVDLGATYVIQRLEFVPRTDLDEPDARCSFQVHAANDTNFTSYAVIAEQHAVPFAYKQINLRNSWIRYLNDSAGYRYLRIRKTSGSNLGVSEFQAYGYPAPPAASGYDLWAASITNGMTNYNQSATGDGYPNLLKYATGSSPTHSDDLARMNATQSGDALALQFSRNLLATDITLIVESSCDLTGNAVWTGIATNRAGSWGGAPNVAELATGATVTATVRDNAIQWTNRFMRLRVTRP